MTVNLNDISESSCWIECYCCVSSCSSGEEAVTTEKETHFTINPIDDEVFDEKDTDVKDDHL